MNPTDNADLITKRDRLIKMVHHADGFVQAWLRRIDEINQTLNPEAYEPQNTDYPRHGET